MKLKQIHFPNIAAIPAKLPIIHIYILQVCNLIKMAGISGKCSAIIKELQTRNCKLLKYYIFSENLVKWVDAANGQVPRRSEIGGMDLSGEIIYVGRAKFSGGLLPGKIVPSHGVCYVSHKGHEHAVCNYQALVKNKLCDSMWVAASKGSIPADALRGGLSAKHKPLYIARAFMYYHGAAAMGTVIFIN